MPNYLYCGLEIASTIAIPDLAVSYTGTRGLFIRVDRARKQSLDKIWSYYWLGPTGQEMLCYGKQPLFHWLRFPGLADFQISENTEEIICYPVPRTPHGTLRHLLLDQVLPRCLANQGKLMLHASAVKVGEGVILFIGDSGTGKSTLAGIFHKAGDAAISDDCVWLREYLEPIVAVPTYSGLRLWQDSLNVLFAGKEHPQSMAHYSTKKRIRLQAEHMSQPARGLPVLAVIVLSPADELISPAISLDRLSLREAFIATLKQTFQLNPADLERMTCHVRALGHIVPRLKTFRLSAPRDYALLPSVREKILKAVL